MKLTRKEVLNSFKCYQVGYCELQYLLRYISADGYTAGVYGWNADIYIFDNIALVTGSHPFGREINHETARKYEQKARKIVDNYDLSYEQKKKKTNKLLEKFIEEVKEALPDIKIMILYSLENFLDIRL